MYSWTKLPKIAPFPLCNMEVICLVIIMLHLCTYKTSQIGRFNCKNIQLARIKKLYATNYNWN